MRLFVPLTRQEFDALREMARVERRRPQDQAAVLLVACLRGVLPTCSRPEPPPGEHDFSYPLAPSIGGDPTAETDHAGLA